MTSIKSNKRNKTLKNKIHNFIYTQQDICCDNDNIDRELVIHLIIKKYKAISEYFLEPDEYLSFINNDLSILISGYGDVKKKYDPEVAKLLITINKTMYKNKILDQTKIENLLRDIPLYLLMSFLGYASLREASIV
jgi:hypothetical protein